MNTTHEADKSPDGALSEVPGPYTADNGHSNSVAADDTRQAPSCEHVGFYYCKKCGKDLTPEIGEFHGRYNDSPGAARG